MKTGVGPAWLSACSGAARSLTRKLAGEAGGHWRDPRYIINQAMQEKETAPRQLAIRRLMSFMGAFSRCDFEEFWKRPNSVFLSNRNKPTRKCLE